MGCGGEWVWVDGERMHLAVESREVMEENVLLCLFRVRSQW